MFFLAVLVVVCVLSYVLREPIRNHPGVLYAVAALLDLAYFAGFAFEVPRPLWEASFFLMQRCAVGLALFVVVMYIGVLPDTSRLSRQMKSIRGELSVAACLLCLGHVIAYASVYASRLFGGVVASESVAAAMVVAALLLLLLLVLGVTSFRTVKKRMKSQVWTSVQRFAYLFYGLVFVHLMLMLAPSAFHGGAAAQLSVAVYAILFMGYAGLRIRRAVDERGLAAASAAVVLPDSDDLCANDLS